MDYIFNLSCTYASIAAFTLITTLENRQIVEKIVQKIEYTLKMINDNISYWKWHEGKGYQSMAARYHRRVWQYEKIKT